MKPSVLLVLCSPYFLQLSVSFGWLCRPASSSAYLFQLHLSAQFIMGKFSSLFSCKRKALLKFWFWWAQCLLCLLSIRKGMTGYSLSAVETLFQASPSSCFTFSQGCPLVTQDFLHLSTKITSLLPDMDPNQFWQSWSNSKVLGWDGFLNDRWDENASYTDTYLRSFWMLGLKFLKTRRQWLLFLLDAKILSVHRVQEMFGSYYAILCKGYKK